MIFEDPSKKRWKVTLSVFIAIICVTSILLGLYIYSFIINPPILSLAKINQEKGKAIKAKIVKIEQKEQSKPAQKKTKAQLLWEEIEGKKIKQVKEIPKLKDASFIRSAFVTQGDPESVNDLKTHIKGINLIFPDWLSFTGQSNEVEEKIDSSFLKYLKRKNVTIFPRISNVDDGGNWYGESFDTYINDPLNRKTLSNTILKTLQKYNLKGINLDFESLGIDAKNNYVDFILQLKEILQKNNMYLSVDVPMNDEAFDYEAIGKIADSVVLMAYDEHYSGGTSGPITSKDWFENGINDFMGMVPKDKIIVALGQYSYDWNVSKKTTADAISFDESMVLAKEVGADIETDKQAVNSEFSYQASGGDKHEVWMLDAISLWNEMCVIEEKGIKGVSVWRLGMEDPSIWGFYSHFDFNKLNPSILERVGTLDTVDYEGQGEILQVRTLPLEGNRTLTFDGREIDYTDYKKLPTSFEVDKFGHIDSHNIALTFDDGPDKVYTDKILDILKKNNVHATFFVVGDQVSRFPQVVKRENKEGHLIGNHTYFHPNLSKVSEERVRLELNSCQRLIEALTGKESILFRSPYSTDSSPSTPSELLPLYTAGKLGYITIDADIDSMDYDKPGVQKIIDNIINQLNDTGSNIIVMHDSGGNRSQTVAALAKLIPLLKDKGYNFVSINDLLGVPKKSLMPSISTKEQFVVLADKIWTLLRLWGWEFIVILFFLSTFISLLRIVFLGFFALKSQKKQRNSYFSSDFEPFVTVLVPAYNEEKVIEKTLSGLLKSDYVNFEILVIDDGSSDNTRTIAESVATGNSKVKVISKPNGGKFSALNLGFKEAKADYVVTIDADTIILPVTIKNLITPFIDDKVDAVCGNVRVGNVKNLVTGFQAVEYITTQNYDRRAFDMMNCISVVPGATGAWKKQKVIEAGGYSDLTLTEDADLTLTMLEKGAKIVYAPDAVSITEAPENTLALFKQRFRWSFGTFQCLWKHRKTFFKGSPGWVALPNMFIFQIIFPVLSPIGDLVFLLSIIRGDMKAIMAGYILFLFMDFAGSLIAFTIDKAPFRYMWLILIQRFFYRQFMYVVTFKSIIASFKGRRHGWNKLDRTNSIKM